jgi:putative spermidine/putrescine transport system permease protein
MTDHVIGAPSLAERWLPGLATAAAVFGYVFLVLPSLIVIPMSFGTGSELVFPPRSYSLELYRQYFQESTWMAVTLQSVKVGLATMAASLVLGFSAAYGISRADFRGKGLLTILLLSPMFMPHIAVALAMYLYLSRLGLVGTTFGLVAAHTVVTVPFVIVTAFAGLRYVDRNLELAAQTMGAGRLRIVWKVVLPLVVPSIIVAALFAFLLSFDEVVISYFISSVQSETLPVKMYSSIHWEISPVLAAISSLLTVLSFGACVAMSLLQRNDR